MKKIIAKPREWDIKLETLDAEPEIYHYDVQLLDYYARDLQVHWHTDDENGKVPTKCYVDLFHKYDRKLCKKHKKKIKPREWDIRIDSLDAVPKIFKNGKKLNNNYGMVDFLLNIEKGKISYGVHLVHCDEERNVTHVNIVNGEVVKVKTKI